MTRVLPVSAAAVRKKEVTTYFQRTPDPADESFAISLLAAGLVAPVVAAIVLLAGSGVLAAAFLVLGVILAFQGWARRADYHRRYAESEPKIPDSEMDGYLKADLKVAAERALKGLGLSRGDLVMSSADADPTHAETGSKRLAEQGSGPLVLFGPVVTSRTRIGVDHIWRFAAYDVMVICPTRYLFGIYTCRLDMITGGMKNDETREFYYKDVVAVITMKAASGSLFVDPQDVARRKLVPVTRTVLQEFQIAVSSADRSAIVVGITDPKRPRWQVRLQESGIERVLEEVRRTLRLRK